jgi:hypothetical protein
MEPTTIIATAIVTGAAAAAGDVAAQAVKDGYAALKALVVRKFGGKADVESAIEGVEKKPDSEARQAVLREELEAAGAGQDAEVLRQARELLEAVRPETLIGRDQESRTVTAERGGIAVGGDVGRDIRVSGRRADEDDEERE